MKIIGNVLLIFVLIFVFSCSASKTLYKNGKKLEETGMYNEASNFYYEALKKDPKNVEATISLKRVATRIYQDKIDVFSNKNKQNYHREAVYYFLDAEKFREKINEVNVNIPKDEKAESDFRESKEIYAQELKQKGESLFAEEKFTESEIYLRELVSLDPENQSYQDLKAMAITEPLYRRGLENFQNKQYRKAYNIFDEIDNYKDSRELKKISREKAKFKIAIIPIRNNTSRVEITDKLYENILKQFTYQKDPFLEIMDYKQVKNILNDKGISVSDFDNNDSKFLNAMAQVFGVDAFLKGSITSANYHMSDIEKTQKTAYEMYYVVKDDKKVREYKKVKYDEYYKINMVEVAFQYNLVSQNAQILITDNIASKYSSSVLYAEYDRDYTNLVPIGKRGPDHGSVNKFMDVFRAPKETEKTQVLENKTLVDISEKLSNKLISYNPEE